jgi:hypothetical protein
MKPRKVATNSMARADLLLALSNPFLEGILLVSQPISVIESQRQIAWHMKNSSTGDQTAELGDVEGPLWGGGEAARATLDLLGYLEASAGLRSGCCPGGGDCG